MESKFGSPPLDLIKPPYPSLINCSAVIELHSSLKVLEI